MIDLEAVEDNLYQVWHDYLLEKTGREIQILLANQDFRGLNLEYPRIMYQSIIPYSTSSNNVKEKDVVDSEDPEFDKDIEYTHVIDRYITFSIEGYGEPSNNVRRLLLLLREWFEIEELGGRFFEGYNGTIVAGQISNVQNRSTFVQNDYEERFGFDVEIAFEDKVKVKVETIESLQINNQELDT